MGLPFWIIFLVTALFYAHTAIHELGHALTARFYGYRTTHFEIGLKRLSFSWVTRGVRFRLGFPPFYGYHQYERPTASRPERQRLAEEIKIILAGPLLSTATLIIIWVLLFSSGHFTNFMYFAAAPIVETTSTRSRMAGHRFRRLIAINLP